MRAAFIAAAIFVMAGTSSGRCDTQFGIEGIGLRGTHSEPRGTVSGSGFGVFLQLDQRWRDVQLHIEGIPSVATASIGTPRGLITSSIGIAAGSVRFRLDTLRRFWFGIGSEGISQQTPLPGFYGLTRVDASRLGGTRLELLGRVPSGTNAFFQLESAVMPKLNGIVHETTTFSDGYSYTLSGREIAAMSDVSLGYGIDRGPLEYVMALRSINFAAKYEDGREADRNVGGGVTMEVRVRI
jgi:hypothetical protein